MSQKYPREQEDGRAGSGGRADGRRPHQAEVRGAHSQMPGQNQGFVSWRGFTRMRI